MNLFLNYMSMHLKVKMQYKISFIFTLLAQSLIVFLELFVLKSLFTKFKLLNEYNINELYLNFSVIWLGYSLGQTLGRGFDKFSNQIKTGNFDLLLIRPRNIFIQIIGSEIYYEKISRIISTLILFIYSSIKVINSFNIFNIFLLLAMIIGSFIISLSIFIIGASICFYTIEGLEIINIFSDGTKQLAQYPMGIYNKIIKVVFTFIIPITLINYYPIEYLTGRLSNNLYLLFPLLSCIIIIPAILLFKLGLKKYKSSGS